MKKLSVIILSLFICQAVFTGTAAAQDRNVIDLKSKDVIKTRGTGNPNINEKNLNDAEAIPAPANKGGSENAGGCEIVFDNYTGFFVEIYIDGNYKGTVPAWGNAEVVVDSGYSKIYCITTGQTKEWNAEGNCNGNYTWKLVQ